MKAKTFLKLVACVAVLSSALMGCADIHKQAFHKDLHRDVKTIGLLEPAGTEEYAVQNLGHVGMAFGLIGGLIAVRDMQSKTEQFTELLKARNFKLVGEFQTALTGELQNLGYTVKIIKVSREKPTFLESYDGLDKDVDAYLDTGVAGGYLCSSGSTSYIPTLRSGARLVKKTTGEIIYQDRVVYGYEFRRLEAITIAAKERYFFTDFDQLCEDPDRALEGLRTGIPLVTKRMAQDLRQ